VKSLRLGYLHASAIGLFQRGIFQKIFRHNRIAQDAGGQHRYRCTARRAAPNRETQAGERRIDTVIANQGLLCLPVSRRAESRLRGPPAILQHICRTPHRGTEQPRRRGIAQPDPMKNKDHLRSPEAHSATRRESARRSAFARRSVSNASLQNPFVPDTRCPQSSQARLPWTGARRKSRP
jgi:hypothetical protein